MSATKGKPAPYVYPYSDKSQQVIDLAEDAIDTATEAYQLAQRTQDSMEFLLEYVERQHQHHSIMNRGMLAVSLLIVLALLSISIPKDFPALMQRPTVGRVQR